MSEEYFIVMQLHRDDLKEAGVKGKFTDAEMKYMATTLGELYCETDFWETLKNLAEKVKRERK